MKRCLACNRTYSDHERTFCPVDGALLTFDNQAQNVAPNPQNHSLPFLEINKTGSLITQPSIFQRNKIAFIFGAVIFLGAAIGAAFIINLFVQSAGKKPFDKNSIDRSNINSNSTGEQDYNRDNSQTAESAPMGKIIDVKGIWIGKNNRDTAPIKIIINSQDGNSFAGTINQRSWRVAIVGKINSETHEITIRDTEVIAQDLQRDGEWSLAERFGTIINDGKKIEITGKDGFGTLSATFEKQ